LLEGHRAALSVVNATLTESSDARLRDAPAGSAISTTWPVECA
jgi:hypothetical protein